MNYKEINSPTDLPLFAGTWESKPGWICLTAGFILDETEESYLVYSLSEHPVGTPDTWPSSEEQNLRENPIPTVTVIIPKNKLIKHAIISKANSKIKNHDY